MRVYDEQNNRGEPDSTDTEWSGGTELSIYLPLYPSLTPFLARSAAAACPDRSLAVSRGAHASGSRCDQGGVYHRLCVARPSPLLVLSCRLLPLEPAPRQTTNHHGPGTREEAAEMAPTFARTT